MKQSNKILLSAFGAVLIVIIGVLLSVRYRLVGDFEFGNKHRITINRDVQNFTKVSVTNGVQVFYAQSDKPSLSYTADSNLLQFIDIYTLDQTLYVKTNRNIVSTLPVEVHISSTTLSEIDISNGAWFHTEDSLITADLSVHSAQGADLFLRGRIQRLHVNTREGSVANVEGSCNTAEIFSASGSKFHADSLSLDHCVLNSESGALNNLCINKTFVMNVNSGARANYHGDPAITKSESMKDGIIMKK